MRLNSWVRSLSGAFIMAAIGFLVPAQTVFAQGDKPSSSSPARERDRIYGSHMMSEQERNDYRERMRSAKSEEERERIRQDHHEQMKQRAKERGVTLPDDPPPRGKGYGPGGKGHGYGPGGVGAPPANPK